MVHKNIKFYRTKLSLSQQQIADALEIDRSTYTYYEQGKTNIPLHYIKKIALIFRITVDKLLEENSMADPSVNIFNKNHPLYEDANELVPDITRLTNAEKYILINFRMKDESGKQKIINIIQSMNEQQ